eukprot:Em0001g2147a
MPLQNIRTSRPPLLSHPRRDPMEPLPSVRASVDGEEDSDEDGLSATPDKGLRRAFPSTPNMFDYSAMQALEQTYTYYPFMPPLARHKQPQLPPDQTCSLPGCSRPKCIEPVTGRRHDYCGKRHALEHRRALQTGTVLPHMKCNTPGCNLQKRPLPDGSGFYDYCSIPCRDCGRGGGSQVVLSPDQLCSLPGCTRARFVDASGKVMDYCSRTHAALDVNGGDMAVRLIQLNLGLADYTKILIKFQNDWATAKGPCPSVDHVFEVSCKNLEKTWKAYKDALATSGHPTIVEQHYHGTTIKCNLISSKSFCTDKDCGICGISQQGFMKKCVGKNIPGFQRFGQGFYLAPHSSKCHDYTQGTHTHRAMLLCDVLPGMKHVVQTDQTHLIAPPPGYDSVYGQSGGSLNYPEIVIYDEASILPRYIIVYQKDGIGKIAK